jgi:magnesium-transporting ATPase (P-type)
VRASLITVKMITGDHTNIAKKTAEQIKLGTNIYGHADLWPVSSHLFYAPFLPH